ncbi:ParB/RepB/Spo0J family partition protein [Gryllotalpicola protaetiae]|uniref:ParB/RepB/Spo0J family partition protein n=1 Tax=Gryllotalpicola protaetiae TaxID=2419771 RepID=A0A387BR54_9MICO|nr:ParB/RepB/Spo0J family partition protein [Gryllotalpicola protaetiae]AYG03539.1 ParB/RepB/Spo0J family partition protein [Gryllotalpicola protaetiae]
MAKRTGLGRGIGALIPTAPADSGARPADVFFSSTDAAPTATIDADASELVAVPGAHLASLSPADIVPNANQPRTEFDQELLDELIASIREVGVLQPIVVRPLKTEDGRRPSGQYELIMGERRLRATKALGLDTIPAVVKDTQDEHMLRDALLENLHRAQLNPLEEASAYQQLLSDFGITQEELAGRIGRSRPQISNTLRLLKLPAPVQSKVAAGVLSAGHARAILAAGEVEAMVRLADKIVNEDLSVRQAEAVVSKTPKLERTKPTAGRHKGHLDDVADRLGDRLNTRVKIALSARKGQITIDFATIQDLNRILTELGETGYAS